MPPVARLRQPSASSSTLSLVPNSFSICQHCHRRLLHATTSTQQTSPQPQTQPQSQHTLPTPLPQVPPPTPLVPTPSRFLSLIGRNLSRHASAFTSWSHLFTASSRDLETLGIPDVRTRRYLLHWRDKFRRGDFGIGGDLQHVDEEGRAQLRVVSVPRLKKEGGENDNYASIATPPNTRRLVVNLPMGQTTYEGPPGELKKPKGFQLHAGTKVKGPYVKAVAGTGGTVGIFQAVEGMWEHKRGVKVDGGERRKAEVRAKRKLEERRKARE